MPNQDGSLTGSDTITLTATLNRIISADSPELAAGTLGILDEVQERAKTTQESQSAFLRIVEALSLDLMSHAVGGFTALTEEEQIASIHNVESSLPEEFNVFLELVRDVYYEDSRTPDRPTSFSGDTEIFGRVEIDTSEPERRHQRESE